jgi:hypothetical protein
MGSCVWTNVKIPPNDFQQGLNKLLIFILGTAMTTSLPFSNEMVCTLHQILSLSSNITMHEQHFHIQGSAFIHIQTRVKKKRFI